MNKVKRPWTIRYTMVVNIAFAAGCVVYSLMAGILGFVVYLPRLSSAVEAAGRQFDPSGFVFTFIASMVLWLLPVPLLLYTNRGLSSQSRNAYVLQIVIALVFLAYVPFGTVLYGSVLVCFSADQKIKMYLTAERQDNV